MDIGKSFTYVFEDPNWIMKLVIGGLVSLVPIVNFAALGYMITTLKNVADGQAQPLPEWSNFGDYFMKGLYLFVGILIYFIPVIVLYCCMFVLSMVAGMGASGNSDAGGALATLVGLLTFCLWCLVILFVLVVAVMLPAAFTRYAVSNQLSVFWDFRGNFDLISKNLSNYIIALLITWVAGFVAGFGVILCLIGVVFTSFWAQLVGAHVYGQFWRVSQGMGMTPA